MSTNLRVGQPPVDLSSSDLDQIAERMASRVRRPAAVRLALPVFFIATVIGFFVVQAQTQSDLKHSFYSAQVHGIEATRTGCERANTGLRQPLYDFLTSAIQVRTKELNTVSAEQRTADAVAVAGYKEERDAIVSAASDFPKSPGSPQVDCQQAFPLPPAP